MLTKHQKYRAKHGDRVRARGRELYQLNREKMIAKSKRYILKNRDKILILKMKHHLKKLYGISWEEYTQLSTSQNGLCAICLKTNQSKRKLAVDHNHLTKKVRALLCDKCNRGLGFFDDNVFLLQKAISYLQHHEK